MKITVNGTEYDSWADVPAELRDKLARVGPALPDTDGDGIPDLLEGRGQLPPGSTTVTTTTITADGKTYNSIDEIPADLRATLQSAGLLGAPRDPDAPPPLRVGGKIVVPAVKAGQPEQAPVQPQLGPGQVLLNGQVVNVDGAPARRRWWKRG